MRGRLLHIGSGVHHKKKIEEGLEVLRPTEGAGNVSAEDWGHNVQGRDGVRTRATCGDTSYTFVSRSVSNKFKLKVKIVEHPVYCQLLSVAMVVPTYRRSI